MRTRLFILVVSAWPWLAAHAQTWTFMGPAQVSSASASGRVSAVVASPTNPSRYFVAGADGGVWRTTDAGVSWTALTDQLPTTAIGALALDPADENTIFAGSGEANFANHSRYGLGVYKSVDGGDTWTHLGEGTFAGRCISRLIVSPFDSRVVFAAVTGAGGFPALSAAKGHPGAGGPVGVFRSADGGVTWQALAGGLPAADATDLAMDPAGVLYAGIGHIFGHPANGLYKSVDGGATWSRLPLPPIAPGRIGVAVSRTNPSRVYASACAPADAGGGSATPIAIYRSDDGGATWPGSTPFGSAPYGWYFGQVAVSPTNADVVYAGELHALRSVNGGASFSPMNVPHPDVHAFAFDAAGRLLVGHDGGVHRSASGAGNDWIPLNSGLGIMQVYPGVSTHPADPEFMLAGFQDNGTARRGASSLVWTSVLSADGGWTQINQANPMIMFAEAQGTGNLYRSINGGTSFTIVGSGITGRNCFLPPYAIDPASPGRMLYATERLWVSTSFGAAGSWTPLSADLTGGGSSAIRALVIAPSDSRHVYAATNNGRVLASADSGATFALRLSDNPGWPRVTRELAVDPNDPLTVYLAGSGFGAAKVRRSRDAGLTWQTLDGDLPDTPVNVIARDPRGLHGVIYAGADGGVWRSTDDGQSWALHSHLPRAAVVDLIVEPLRNRIVASTMGRSVWAAPLSCAADFNGSGGTPDDADVFAFILAWSAGASGADLNVSGGAPDDADVTYFFQRWNEGC